MVAAIPFLCYDLDMPNEAEIKPNLVGPHKIPTLDPEVANSEIKVIHEDEDHREVKRILGQFAELGGEAEPPITEPSGKVALPQKSPGFKQESGGHGIFHFRTRQRQKKELKNAV